MPTDEQIIHDLTLLYLSAHATDATTPEELKKLYFKIYQQIKNTNVERWD